jgi:molybdopterin converting factor small subunit
VVDVEVQVPGMLRDCTAGRARVTVRAATLSDALARMLEAYPLLRVHLYDETRQLRKHVLVFYNDESIKRMPDLDVPLRAGDQLTIVQAVSGG